MRARYIRRAIILGPTCVALIFSTGGLADARPRIPVFNDTTEAPPPPVVKKPVYVPPPKPVYVPPAPKYVPPAPKYVPPAPVYEPPPAPKYVPPPPPAPVIQAPVVQAPVVQAPIVEKPVIPDVPKPVVADIPKPVIPDVPKAAVVPDLPKPAVVVPAPVVPTVPKPAAAVVPDPKVPAAAVVVPKVVSPGIAASNPAADAASKAADAAKSAATKAADTAAAVTANVPKAAPLPGVTLPALPKVATVTAQTVTLPDVSGLPNIAKPTIPSILAAGLPEIPRPNLPNLPNITRPSLVTSVGIGAMDNDRHRSNESSRNSVSASDLAWLGKCWNGSQVTVTNACLRAVAAHASWFDGCNFNFWVEGAGWIRTSQSTCAQVLQYIFGVRPVTWNGCNCDQYTYIAPSGLWCTGYYRNNVFTYTGYYPRWVTNADQARQAQAAGQVVFEPPSVTAIVGDSAVGADVKLASAPNVPAAPTADQPALLTTTAVSQALEPGILPVSHSSSRVLWLGPLIAVALAMLIAAWFTDRRQIELESKLHPPTSGGGRMAGGFA